MSTDYHCFHVCRVDTYPSISMLNCPFILLPPMLTHISITPWFKTLWVVSSHFMDIKLFTLMFGNNCLFPVLLYARISTIFRISRDQLHWHYVATKSFPFISLTCSSLFYYYYFLIGSPSLAASPVLFTFYQKVLTLVHVEPKYLFYLWRIFILYAIPYVTFVLLA